MEQFMTSSASNKTDIDALVLFEQRVNLVNCPIILMQMARVLVPVEFTDKYRIVVVPLGLLMQFSVVFCIAHRAFGSLVIAGVRVLYIKFHHVLLRVGIDRFVSCAKWLGFSVSLILASGQVTETFFFRNPGGMVFYAFFTDLSPYLEEFEAVFDHICATFSLLANLFEFLFFLIIIGELTRLNRGAAALFSSSRRNVAMKRARKNAITGMGHFISWLIELLLFGFCQGRNSIGSSSGLKCSMRFLIEFHVLAHTTKAKLVLLNLHPDHRDGGQGLAWPDPVDLLHALAQHQLRRLPHRPDPDVGRAEGERFRLLHDGMFQQMQLRLWSHLLKIVGVGLLQVLQGKIWGRRRYRRGAD